MHSAAKSVANRLIHETSPYLLQHAHNPVDWYPWGDEAFQKAKAEDKPVLVSIGYAACHWCHVMERESFEDPDVAAFMNDRFVNIKVDREERPDVDGIYMDAVQAITGSGGWPLNVFLTPDGRPFYGGTYYPPRRAFNRASWLEVLTALAQAYAEKREDIQSQAENLTAHLQQSNAFGTVSGNDAVFTAEKITDAFKAIMKSADKVWGGFGRAPKFPQTFTIQFLLRYHHLIEKKVVDENPALKQGLLSLDKMLYGGIYDQVGGGFARYSTDGQWLAPHFEKMLYDNALLVITLCEAYSLTGHERYKQTIDETLAFVNRELTHPDGGFYSALDADSEGEEGKFYIWIKKEIDDLLGEESPLFCKYFDVSEGGNWEGKNILRVKVPLPQFAAENNVDEATLRKTIEAGKEKLLQKRSARPRPLLDDKLLLNWNALMNKAYSQAFAATGNERYKDAAVKNMRFLLQRFSAPDNKLYHTWKADRAKYPAFLDDYAFLIAALIELAQVTADFHWLQEAKRLTGTVLQHFSDEASPLFFYSPDFQTDLLVRKKEVYDAATPSGNAVMAGNLYRLSILFDEAPWREKAAAMMQAMGEVAIKYPTSFGVWLSVLFEMITGTAEVAITGPQAPYYLTEILAVYHPHRLLMAANEPQDEFPLLKNKAANGKTLIYVCKQYVCRQPVASVADFKNYLQTDIFNRIQ